MTTTPIHTGPTGPASTGPSKVLIALIAAGGVLLLAAVALAFLFIGQQANGAGGSADGPKPPVTTPTSSPTQNPTTDNSGGGGSNGGNGGGGGSEAPATAQFTSFSADRDVSCDPSGQEEKPSPSISWASANAVAVYWTPNDNEANASNGYEVGTSGNQDDLSASKGPGERFEFPCNHDQYFDTTITLVGASGETVSKTVTFVDVNWGMSTDEDE